jgi:hypothetical protein
MAKPLIKRFMEVFEAEVLRVDAPAPTPVIPSQIHEAASVERLESGEGGDSTGSSDTGG